MAPWSTTEKRTYRAAVSQPPFLEFVVRERRECFIGNLKRSTAQLTHFRLSPIRQVCDPHQTRDRLLSARDDDLGPRLDFSENLRQFLASFVDGGPASQKLGAAGTRNLEWTLIPRLRPLWQLNVKRRFLMLRTQLDASCATRGSHSSFRPIANSA